MRGLADSHVHLHAYDDEAVAAMLERARAAGVDRLVAVAVDLPSARRTLELAARYPGRVLAAAGLHPGNITEMPDDATWAALDELAEHGLVRAIGECGVDGVEGKANWLVQLAALARQARSARRLDKPLLLHLRGDELIGPALGVLANAGIERDRAVVHYFVGDTDLAERYLEAGLFLSVGKPVMRAGNEPLRAAIRAVPLERLLLETDTYPIVGRTTEPADVRLVAEAVAQLKGIELGDVARATGDNFARLVGD